MLDGIQYYESIYDKIFEYMIDNKNSFIQKLNLYKYEISSIQF